MKKLARSILSNLFTFFLSLALAILIWVNAQQTEDPLRSEILTLPVNVINQPDDSIILDPAPERLAVQLVFEGPSSVIREASTSDFTASIDLIGVPFGEETVLPVDIQTSIPEITYRSQPLEITVLVEQLVTREIPVVLDMRGDVARGYTQGTPLIDPPIITVSGPASSAASLDFARVTVFLNNDRADVLDSRQPIFYDRQGRVASVRSLTLSDDQINITIPVLESAGYSEKSIDVDLVGQPAPGYRVLDISVTPVSVLVQGRPTLLSQLDRVQTEPIDITGLTEPYRQQVALSLPEGITQDEVEEIFVEIDIEPLFTTDTYNPKVFIQGLDEDLEAAVNPDTVRVVLSGPLPALETLLDEEVSVTIDLFGLMTGTYSLEPTVSFPDRGIELRSIQPSQVTVEITRPLTITNELTGTLPITGTTASTITRPDTVDNDHNATYSLLLWPSQIAVLPNPHSFPKRVKS
jgi:YbbR domain-containing protein